MQLKKAGEIPEEVKVLQTEFSPWDPRGGKTNF